MMPLIQKVSADGRVPPCEAAKLLSLRHLSSFAKSIPLPPIRTLIKHSLLPVERKGAHLTFEKFLQSTNVYLFAIQRHGAQQVQHSEFGVREAGYHACLWGLKEAVPPSRLGMARNSQNSVSLLAFERVLFPRTPPHSLPTIVIKKQQADFTITAPYFCT
jgi:hypothetical protein